MVGPRRACAGVGMLLALSVFAAGRLEAVERVVTDFGDSNGPGQLRTLIDQAAVGGGDVIVVPAGPPIVLALGELVVAKTLTIQGAGPGLTVLDGAGAARVLRVTEGPSGATWVALSRMTITNGRTVEFGGGILVAAAGDPATLALSEVDVVGNRATGGGGLAVETLAALVMTRSTVRDNQADPGDGGGVYTTGTVTIDRATISGNRAVRDGGGLRVAGGVTTVTHATLADNRADSDDVAGGTGGGLSTIAATVRLRDTLVGGNAHGATGAFPDCGALFASLGTNLVQDPTGCQSSLLAGSDLAGVDPQLEPLRANGGPTLTHALLPGSPAIDAASGDCGGADQRGIRQPQGARCDIGALERVQASRR